MSLGRRILENLSRDAPSRGSGRSRHPQCEELGSSAFGATGCRSIHRATSASSLPPRESSSARAGFDSLQVFTSCANVPGVRNGQPGDREQRGSTCRVFRAGARSVLDTGASRALYAFHKNRELRRRAHPAMPGAVTAAPAQLNVCASVVTYHPGPQFPGSFADLMRQVPRWLIIDNCSAEEDRRRLRKLACSSVEVIENPDNLGVATALNQAARRAHSLGCGMAPELRSGLPGPRPKFLVQLMAAYGSVSQPEKLANNQQQFPARRDRPALLRLRSGEWP